MIGRSPHSPVTAAACIAAALLVAACNPDSASTGPSKSFSVAAHISLAGGDGQQSTATAPLPAPITAKVTDANGLAVSGATVTFRVLSGGGSVAATSAISDGSGLASTTWTLGSTVGMQQVVAGLKNSYVSDSLVFSGTLVAVASGPGVLAIRRVRTPLLQADTTGATIGSSDDFLAGVRDTLIVQVYAVNTGLGAGGQSVSWATQAGSDVDGFPVNALTVTDAQGFAKTLWVLRTPTLGKAIPPSSIAKRMIATAAGVGQVEFQARVHPGRVAFVNLVASVPSPVVRASTAVTATVTDFSGNPISGAVVNFAVAGGGGSVVPSPVTANNAGVATTTWTVGNLVGVNTLTATATATATPYTLVASVAEPIRVTSVAAAPAAIVVVGPAPPATAVKGSTITFSIQVNAADLVAIPNVVVGFAASAGGSVVPDNAITDANGQILNVTWTLSGAANATNTLTVTAGAVTKTFTIVGGP